MMLSSGRLDGVSDHLPGRQPGCNTESAHGDIEDSGELVVAADYLGVRIRRGYLTWTIIAWLFTEYSALLKYFRAAQSGWGLISAQAFSAR